MIKKFFIAIGVTSLLLAPVAITSGSVQAQDPIFEEVCDNPKAQADNPVCQEEVGDTNPVANTLKNVIQLLALAVGTISVFVIVIAGFRFITSSGDPSTINSAKNQIIFALVGVAIAISGQLIVSFVLNRI